VQLSRNARPPRPGPRIRFECVKHTQPEDYVVIGRQVWTGHVHYLAGRSVPCVREHAECPNCNPQTPRRWIGYLHTYTPNLRSDIFLTLPPGAGYALLEGLATDYDLRGRRLRVWRQTKAITSQLCVTLDPIYQASFQVMPEKNPAEYLEFLFKKVEHLTRPYVTQ